MRTSPFAAVDTMPSREIAPGVKIRIIVGQGLMLGFIDLAEGAAVPMHQHVHEQAGVVLAGTVEMSVGDEKRLLGPGDAYAIPANTPHAARPVGGPARVLDAFHPPREDYVKLFQ
jgi:quercetin dioxygenase-like cupin family protein